MAPGPGAKYGPRRKKEGKSDLYRIGGVDLPFDPDLDLDKPKATPLFPPYDVKAPRPLADKEKAEVANFKSLRSSIHDGPLYTVLGDNVRVGKPAGKAAATINPFEGMPKYSQRYTQKKRMIPKLDTRPYVLKFFPEELWSTLDPTATQTKTVNGTIDSAAARGKTLQLPAFDTLNNPDADNMSGGEEGDDKPGKDPDEEEPLEGEEVDDEYEDDEEDGGDYNAEQYFDDGGDDAGDDYDGGGDEGGGYYD